MSFSTKNVPAQEPIHHLKQPPWSGWDWAPANFNQNADKDDRNCREDSQFMQMDLDQIITDRNKCTRPSPQTHLQDSQTLSSYQHLSRKFCCIISNKFEFSFHKSIIGTLHDVLFYNTSSTVFQKAS